MVKFNLFFNYTLTLLYVLFATLVGVYWVIYSEKKQNSWFVKTKKRFIIYCMPLFLSLLAILSTPFTHCYFYFEDNHYQRGPLFVVFSLLLLVYALQTGIFALIKSFKKENYVDRYEYRRLFAFALVYLIVQFIQLALPPVFPYRSVGIMLVFYVFLVQNMKEMIGNDVLTHINNRFAAERFLGSKMNNKETFEVALIDLDKFKSINDTYGHQEGDKALQYLSETLSNMSDKIFFIARMGGDEFIIVNSDKNHSIVNVEETINNELTKVLEKNNCDYRFTVSVGYAMKDDSIKSIPDLIAVADQRLYEHKEGKKKNKD